MFEFIPQPPQITPLLQGSQVFQKLVYIINAAGCHNQLGQSQGPAARDAISSERNVTTQAVDSTVKDL